VHLWRRTAEPQWVKAHEHRLQVQAHGDLVTVQRPGRKRFQLEIVCRSRSAARALVRKFGGRIEQLPPDWLERFTARKPNAILIGKRLVVATSVEALQSCSVRCSQWIPLRLSRPHAPRIASPTAYDVKPPLLVIPASLAFGTGEHVTTAMSLRFLEELSRRWKRGWSLVDLGTGSGILALAAKRFGAGRVTAIDVDPTAISIAESNARLNQIHGITFRLSDVRKWRSTHETDVITANLYSELLIEILSKLKRGGRLILSGILHRDEAEFLHALSRNNLEIIRIKRRGKWIAILARCSSTLRAADLACGKFLRRSQTAATVERNAN
jgi:ribosomal protein L11 methyltransferase